MPVNTLENFTREQFNRALGIMETSLTYNAVPSGEREAYLLGGQSGAGKSTLHKILRTRFDNNAIVINGDEYRKSHPHFLELDAAYGKDAVAHTAAWAGAMTEALIDTLSLKGYNLIIEGTLRTSSVPLKTAELLKGRGYAVSLALMAVKPQISLVSCQLRYEQMRIAGTTSRATDPSHHNAIVGDIAQNLFVLEQSGVFEAILLYDRSRRCLYPEKGKDASAAEVLHDALFGEWTPEEMGHYAMLKRRLEELKSQRLDE